MRNTLYSWGNIPDVYIMMSKSKQLLPLTEHGNIFYLPPRLIVRA